MRSREGRRGLVSSFEDELKSCRAQDEKEGERGSEEERKSERARDGNGGRWDPFYAK